MIKCLCLNTRWVGWASQQNGHWYWMAHRDYVDWISLWSLLPKTNAILSVVGPACPSMEALLLPLQTISDGEGGVSYVKQLRSALESWFRSNGGLRHLRVPWIPEDEKNELLQAITTFCPRIEYLQSDIEKCLGSRLYDVPISTWIAFCDRCTSLRELDWSMVPSLQHYAQAFTAKTWTNLFFLRIRYHPGEPNTTTRPRFVRSELRAVFAACPSLKVLELTAPSDADTGGEEFGFDGVLWDVSECCASLETVRIRPTDRCSAICLPRSHDLSPLLAMPRLSCLEIDDLKDENGSSITNVLRLSPPYLPRRVILRAQRNRHDAIVNALGISTKKIVTGLLV